MATLEVAHAQLTRMRGMNAAYHNRFFSDVRATTLTVLALFITGAAIDRRLYLAVPVIALLGACQTAFDASYLIFSRQYAARLERFLNDRLGQDLLVAHRMEDEYLFPLDTAKVVTLSIERFSWFGFMTALYTIVGIGAYVVGLIASLDVIGDEIGLRFGGIYLIALAIVTIAALGVGFWWFPQGEGERRLRKALGDFGSSASTVRHS